MQIKLLKVIESESTTFQHIVDNRKSALLLFGVLRFLGLQLELVEALAVGAGDEALRYESVGVDTLDDSENRHRFEASRHNNEHLDLMFAIPSLITVHPRRTLRLMASAILTQWFEIMKNWTA